MILHGKAKQSLIVPTMWKLYRCFQLSSVSSSVAGNYWGNFQCGDVPHKPPAKSNLSWSLGITCCHLSTLLACNDKFSCSHLCFPKCGLHRLQKNSSRSRYVSKGMGRVANDHLRTWGRLECPQFAMRHPFILFVKSKELFICHEAAGSTLAKIGADCFTLDNTGYPLCSWLLFKLLGSE